MTHTADNALRGSGGVAAPNEAGRVSQNDLGRVSGEKRAATADGGRRAVRMSVDVVRKDDELGILWGYASVADIVDLQGDVVPQAELVSAVYAFMEKYYFGAAAILENHGEQAETVLVESTLHFLAGKLRWYIGVKLLSEELREKARKGEISGFSIGGTAREAA